MHGPLNVKLSLSYICNGVGPLVDPFRSHVSRSFFKGVPWFLLPVGEEFFITLRYLLLGILFTCCIQFLLYSSNLSKIGDSQRCNCFIRNGGNAIPKHVGLEAEGSNPTTGLTLLWARNPFGGNFNHWQVSWKEAGQIFFKCQIIEIENLIDLLLYTDV
jgi:hypothetical protein